MVRRLAVGVGMLLLSSACGGDKSPTAPSPPPIANIAGNWTGNLESTNYSTRAVEINFTQAGGSVNGTWVHGGADWNGTISGTIGSGSFTGTFTLSAPNSLGVGPRCTGTASVSGGAATGQATLQWTSPGFTGSCTGMPINLRWNLQRR